MSRNVIHSVILAASALCIAASACAADASAPAFAMPGPLPCMDSAARVQGHAMLRASVSAAVGQVGKQFHVPDWQPGLTLYDRTLDSVYGTMLADSELTARFARVSGETYVRYILARGAPEQQQSFGRWLAGTDVGGRFWTLVVDEGLCAGLLDGLAENAQVTSPEDRLAVRDWQAKRQADHAQWRSDDTQDAGFQVNARLWLGLLRQAPFDQGAVWGRVLATRAGEEEPILKAMRPALTPLLPEIDAAGKAAAEVADGEEVFELWASVPEGPALSMFRNGSQAWLMYLREPGDSRAHPVTELHLSPTEPLAQVVFAHDFGRLVF